MTLRRAIVAQAVGLFFVFANGHSVPADEMDAAVRGEVLVDGHPLASGRIFFYLDDDQFVGGQIKEGAYKVARVPAGVWHVAFDGEGVPARYTAKTRGEAVMPVQVRGDSALSTSV